MTMNPDTLKRLEAGLKAELDVLRETGRTYIKQDLDSLASTEGDIDLDLNSLRDIKALLQEQHSLGARELASSLQYIQSYSVDSLLPEQGEEEEEDEEVLAQQVKLLRRRTLQFAKTQYPVEQAAGEFEGGDFWDAVVAHCKDEHEEDVEYSADKESGLAELLLQSGVFERGSVPKRIRIVRQVFGNYKS
ncbi:hypothetical protein BASA81_006788 [Batrachochytrium salamandrivorans]|nr:hypothetical protein BASA81_006788 [Batrachochytrium salamandrivorans]